MEKSIKGTKTEQNLLKSFAGESQARGRYTYFASVAKKEGYEQIAAIFGMCGGGLAVVPGLADFTFMEEKEGKSLIRIWNEVRDPEKIDPEKVFERFYKADEARSKTSSGLGLSIAKEFADQMHGQIRARLEGKIFYIEICFNINKKGSKINL